MTVAGPGTGLVSGCQSCGGIWVDNVAGQIVAEEKVIPAIRGFVRHFDSIKPPDNGPERGYREEQRTGRQCPICRASLSQVAIGSATLDACMPHGTFFDRTELHYIQRGVEQRMIVEEERRKDRERRGSSSWNIFDIVVGLLSGGGSADA